MKQIFKYPGGKKREIKNILPYISKKTKRIIEPFAGAAVLSLFLEKPSIVSDVNDDVINLLKVIQDNSLFQQLQELILSTNIGVGEENIQHLNTLYYKLRDGEWKNPDKLIKAYRFLVLRQLCFSGMYRVNEKTGKFNVPYGWYPTFKTSLSTEHNDLLQTWEILEGDFTLALRQVKENDFVFLDPPYFERNSAYHTNSDAGDKEDLHLRMFAEIKELDVPWLVIHSDCELYQDIYHSFNIVSHGFSYCQNFKGRSIKNGKVNHLYISNIKLDNNAIIEY